MFPPRKKSARVKKEAQFFQDLLGVRDGEDAISLFEAARDAARDRVVVKRPAKAPPLVATPNHSVSGSRVRWDVYLTLRQPAG